MIQGLLRRPYWSGLSAPPFLGYFRDITERCRILPNSCTDITTLGNLATFGTVSGGKNRLTVNYIVLKILVFR